MFSREDFYKASSQQSDLRLPKTLPKCMTTGKVAPPAAPYPSPPGSIAGSISSSQSRQKPQAPKQRYIPGLNSAEDPNVVLPANAATKRHIPKEVSVELVEGFLDGSKQPISALMEYGVAMKIVVIFEEVRVERPSIVAKFANRVKANGKPFPQGVGKTKKEAKTAAAKVAMNLLLGVGEDGIDEDDDVASISKASILTSTTFEPQVELPSFEEAGVRPLWDPPKHPVSRFTEYCARNLFEITWKVSDKPTDIGFRAQVFVNEELKGEAYALNKKDAKKLAAEKAIELMCPQHLSSVENSESTKPSKPQPVKGYMPPPQPVGGMPMGLPQTQTTLTSHAPTNYVTALDDFCDRNDINMEMVSSGDNSTGGFEAYVNIDNQAVAFAHAGTQADAKSQAAEEALNYLSKYIKEKPEPKLETLPFHDQIAAQAHRMLKILLAPTGESVAVHKYLAAFVVKRAGVDDIGKVVALGTGNTCIPGANRAPNGRILNDCHAVVIARRALLKYLHRELKMYFEGHLISSIFEPLDGSHLLTFKQGVTLHLYMSRAPCGDVALYTTEPDGPLTEEDMEIMNNAMHYPSFPDDNAGYTSVKGPKGFDVTLASEEAPKSGTMSCSEKILKWNTVGIQGALFSQYLAPLYVTSITLGSMYNHGNLSRGVAGRLTDDIAEYLPAGFQVNYPSLGRATMCNASYAQTVVCPESINWSFGDEMIEIVSGYTGKTSDRSPAKASAQNVSRLCKAGFLFRFRQIAKLSHNVLLLQIPTYADCKASSISYQQAKKTLIEHLEVTGFGFWVKKLPGLETFAK